MVAKIKKVSVEKYGKSEEEIIHIGYPRWSYYSPIYNRLMVIGDENRVIHLDKNNNIVLNQYIQSSTYGVKFSKGLSFYLTGCGIINKYNPNTNSYTSVNVPTSCYWGTEALGTNYYWVMTVAYPCKLEIYNLDGEKVNEIILEIGLLTETISNVDGSVFFGWSYYDPSKLVIVNVNGNYEIKDISHLEVNWFRFVEIDKTEKKIFCIINNRKFGILDIETLEFDVLFESDYSVVDCVGFSKNYKYVVITYMPYKARVIDLDTRRYEDIDLVNNAMESLPYYPRVTNDGKGLVVFHPINSVVYVEIRDIKKKTLIDGFFACFDYPSRFDVNEFEV